MTEPEPDSDSPPTLPSHLEQAMLTEARAEVGVADSKASMVLAALGIGFGAVLAGLIAGNWKPSDLGAGERLWWIGAAMALGSVGTSAAAVWPRFIRADARAGVYYWGHVATFKRLEDLAKALDDMPSDAAEALRTRHQLWRLSGIVATKYTLVRLSIALAGGSILVLLASVML